MACLACGCTALACPPNGKVQPRMYVNNTLIMHDRHLNTMLTCSEEYLPNMPAYDIDETPSTRSCA